MCNVSLPSRISTDLEHEQVRSGATGLAWEEVVENHAVRMLRINGHDDILRHHGLTSTLQKKGQRQMNHAQFTREQWYVLYQIFRLVRHRLGYIGTLMWMAAYTRDGAMLIMDVR